MAESTKHAKVLVVEDETIIASNICSSLQQFGYSAEYVNSGEQALEFLKDRDADIVLMDIMLGEGMDGIEASLKIREIREIPVIYLTAYSDQGTLERAQITEPSGYIIKPFHSRELFIAIELALYKFQSMRSFREIQTRLYESQRMESIGLLSSGIAHEINNPLTGILNFSILGQEQATKTANPELVRYFSVIQSEAEKIARIVKTLINYASEDRESWIWIDLDKILEEILSLFRQLFLRESIHLEWEPFGSMPSIYCKPQKLKQAILNLISFCRLSALEKDTGQNRWIRIATKPWKDSHSQPAVCLEISDSGNGIRDFMEDTQRREKNPYSKYYSLAGLGFHFSRSVVHEHKGEIQIDGDSGKKVLRLILPTQPW